MKKVVYITGGTKGIGLGIAKSLVEVGYRVAISGRNEETAQKVAEKIGDKIQIIGLGSDVRKLKDEYKTVSTIIKHFGRLDVVIANAGLGIFDNIRDLEPEAWHKMLDTNLTGVFNSIKASVEELISRKGYFISIASLAGINFFKNGSGYNASKFGVVGFTQSVMLDLRTEGVKTTVILPGSVTSNFNNHTPDQQSDRWKVQPEDMGQLIVDLLDMNPRALPSKVEIRPTQTADML